MSRGPVIGVIRKEYVRRRDWNQDGSSSTDIKSLLISLDSLSIDTDRSDQELYDYDTRESSQFNWSTQNNFDYSNPQISYKGLMSQQFGD